MLGVAYPGQIYPAGVPSLGGIRQIDLVLGSLGSHAEMWDGRDATAVSPGKVTHELYGSEEATPAGVPTPPHHEFY